MEFSERLFVEHLKLTRRYFLKYGALSGAVFALPGLRGSSSGGGPGQESDRAGVDALADAVTALEYLTRPEDFGTVERGDPLPYKHPREKRLAVGLERETWKLEVVPDLETDAEVEEPLSKVMGTALDFASLMKLAETRAVRYLKIMTCLNMGSPLGTGLWEGVPLRDIIWLAKPVRNIRRVYYYGYHNDDPEQLFQSSLPIGRVLEDPPGEYPVLVCYKLNGKWLSGKRGGPVRILVPEAYGFKSIKWLQRVVLTNRFNANDTYERGNNDVDTPMKTFARFLFYPKKTKADVSLPVTGLVQVGMSGFSKVQYWLQPEGEKWPPEDPYFTGASWRDAQLLPPPASWGSDLGNKLSGVSRFGDNGRPSHWPLRYSKAHWAALVPGVPAGTYWLRCRTVDGRGVAQPMPRPFAKSGRNAIHRVKVVVET